MDIVQRAFLFLILNFPFILLSCAESTTQELDSRTDADMPDLADGDGTDPAADVVCLPGETSCDGLCVDTDSSHEHCGGCNNACPAEQSCSGGMCLIECPADTVDCSGSCVDVLSDRNHCGECGHVCEAGLNAMPLCELGLCSVVCLEGWFDTDGDGSCESECSPTSTTEICNGIDDDCDGRTDEDFDCRMGFEVGCTTLCGSTGTGLCGIDCTPPAPGACTPPGEICNGTDDDCDGTCDNGFDCCRGDSGSCTTDCGSTGTHSCAATCAWGPCYPPGETCNGSDDDCDGTADNVSGCTLPVYRFVCGSDHFYKNDASVPGGCSIEGGGNPVWYMYASAVSGTSFSTLPLYRLYRSSPPDHFYTIDGSERSYALSIGYVDEGQIGHCAPSAAAGRTTPCFRLLNSSTGDHFYTTSESERDNAVASYGYTLEGTACHVFPSP
jgi:hypothetical protein